MTTVKLADDRFSLTYPPGGVRSADSCAIAGTVWFRGRVTMLRVAGEGRSLDAAVRDAVEQANAALPALPEFDDE